MRGSAALRASVAPGGALAGPWVRNALWTAARAVPSLDLRFAENKSLTDATTGQNLVTFTRASSGTFVGSDGVLRTAVTNLLLRSEELDNASWLKSECSISITQVVAPNGTITADEIIENTSTANHIALQNFTSVSGFVYTYSVYVKAGQRGFCFVTANGTGTLHGISVNLSTGSATSAVGSPSSITSLAIGNGWYRVNFTYTSGTTGIVSHEVRISTDGVWANRSYTGNGAGSVYAWGAQLEQSATVGEYIPTTSTINSAPRFDHNPTTGESLGLLVEEQRTNLLTYSEDVSQWASPFNTTLTTNSIAAPDGAITADRLLETTATNLHTCDSTAFVFVTGTTYTYSVFVKPIGNRNFEIAFPATIFTARFARFTLSGSGSVQGTDAGVTASISSLPNGWYRCVATSTCASGAGSRIGNFINDSSSSRSYTGDTSAGIYLWGAQLEAGAFPTSYIPTTTAAATRSADVASITGTNFSSWYRQDEGTVFAQAIPASASSSFARIAAIETAAFASVLSIQRNNTDARGFGSGVSTIISSQAPSGSLARIAFAGRVNDFALSANGQTVNEDNTTDPLPTATLLGIGQTGVATNLLNGTIRRITYWPARLGNEVLQRITQ